MAVLAGVDLLAKLYAGNDATSGGAIGQRFRTFADQRMSGGDGASLWQLRNAVLHSYGVYFEEPAPAPPGGRGGSSLLPSVPKKFRLSATVNSLITPIAGSLFANLPNDIIEIDVNELKASFDAAIANYETYIRGNATEQISHFEPMFKKYGWLYICEETITGSGLLLTKGASGG
ncbi:MAG: hypothetical protein K2Y22_03125 [Candidatus Obscuribacterales bacterium]|nr:hypothetical protein [Candidatus Obscuribacterales bacterium]